ncbi:MAG TPA: hypothetical protein VMW56_08290 [Candidatus Margulisiibacteriota bacterium]|nr:hypothetical protein [Candidatus Margulisiibacteriota bacterium]
MSESVANSQSASATAAVDTAAVRRSTIVMVRWALIITCAYLVLFSEETRGATGLAPLVIVAFLASNLIIGRLPVSAVTGPAFRLGVASLDTVLIGLSLFCAAQLSVELVVLLLGVLVLAIAGIRLGIIAVLTIGLAIASLLMVWANGNEPLQHSSMLLRVPFLLAAGVAYAWLAETERPTADGHATDLVGDLTRDLALQLEAIERCQTAASQGLMSATQGLLAEIAEANQQMRSRIAGAPAPEVQVHQAPAMAHSAA